MVGLKSSIFCRLIVLLLIISGIIQITDIFAHKFDILWEKRDVGYEDWQMGAFLNKEDNSCQSIELGFKVNVELRELDDAMGMWIPVYNTIYLEETDTDTIAHEVYHMTQTMMRRYGLHEEEFGAFMQGSFTECIIELIEIKKHNV